MLADPIIADSARRHGVPDEDMLHAYRHPIRVFELDDGFMVIGPNQTAIVFEVGVVQGDAAPVIVQAMSGTREVSEVTAMPRSVDDILKHADELAKRFEEYELKPEDERDPDALNALRRAVTARSDAERSIQDAVGAARQAGLSWALIGSEIGTSGEAVRQRYGRQRQKSRR